MNVITRISSGRARPRVLCAEDNCDIRKGLGRLLSRATESVEFAEDGHQALLRLAADPELFDILVTDHLMPSLDGLSLVRQLRRTFFPGKIVVFSSDLTPLVRASYEALCVDRILNKPIDGIALPRAIEHLYRPDQRIRH